MKNHIVVSLLMATLASCATDPNAGMVAARDAGLGTYLRFTRNGKPDSAALLPFEGKWWFYHPSNGSTSTGIPDSSPPPILAVRLYLDGISGRPALDQVKSSPAVAELQNGCLPRALCEARLHGGSIQKFPGHAQVFVPEQTQQAKYLASIDDLNKHRATAERRLQIAQSQVHEAKQVVHEHVGAPTATTPHRNGYTDKYGTQYLHPVDQGT
jgi:hypothetical protein